MKKHDLYSASYAGMVYGNGANEDEYRMVVITKWKNKTEKSPEEGHKIYYFVMQYRDFLKINFNKELCKKIYSYPEYTRFNCTKKYIHIRNIHVLLNSKLNRF